MYDVPTWLWVTFAVSVVTMLTDVRHAECVVDEQILGVGGPAVGDHVERIDTRRKEWAHRRTRRGDATDDLGAVVDRHPSCAGEDRLRGCSDEALLHRG